MSKTRLLNKKIKCSSYKLLIAYVKLVFKSSANILLQKLRGKM